MDPILILSALAFAGQQPRDLNIPLNTERLGRTKKYALERQALRPLAPGELARFSDLPNVAVTYYDVPGRNLVKIHGALARLGPRDPATHKVLPATSSWTVGVKVRSRTTGRQCAITGVDLLFRGAATMPRLLPDKDRPPPVTNAWNAFIVRLEARQAEQLRFAFQRMDGVRQAVLASSCSKAEAAADAALAKLEEQRRLAFSQDPKDLPRLEDQLEGT